MAFVILWSTGFIAARYGLPYAPPLRFLLLRFTLVAALMTVVALATRARWPANWRVVAHVAVASWLVNGVYLGGVFISIANGMSAGTSAMLVGLQPVLTVFLARAWLGERVAARQWLGLAAGLAGVWLVVRHKIAPGSDPLSLLPIVAALVGISVGTLYQKKYASAVDLRTGAVIQFAACAVVYLPLVLWTQPAPVAWTASFAFALAWSVVVLSAGAISLLYWLLRHGAAADVAGLFYLVPPVTALMAWWMFGDVLGVAAFAGMALIAVGVALARRPAAEAAPSR
ncbi:MAG: DMT family transporter [Proteobacteria bacterium]|jgi:drug/metabolite transporter (DMT)-like permease|nr:DMT family transporter [Pseudomonadota bacterium]